MADLNDCDFKRNITEGYVFIFYNAACDNTGVRYPASIQLNISELCVVYSAVAMVKNPSLAANYGSVIIR